MIELAYLLSRAALDDPRNRPRNAPLGLQDPGENPLDQPVRDATARIKAWPEVGRGCASLMS